MVPPLELLTLEDGVTRAVLAPTRGGMLTGLSVSGRELLYMDEATLRDPTKNVRGGNPVLFPSPGPLANDRFTWKGRSGSMKQHGLARQRPWAVVVAGPTSATLRLASDASTSSEFPWRFTVELRYDLVRRGVRIVQTVTNADDQPMPFAIGFHPYFAVPSGGKGRVAVPTPATHAWDNVQKRDVPITSPIRFADVEVDLHLLDHEASRATLDLGDGARVDVSASDAFRRWVIWTLPGRDFVCLEPWTAPANALGTGEGVREIAPGASEELWTEITLA